MIICPCRSLDSVSRVRKGTEGTQRRLVTTCFVLWHLVAFCGNAPSSEASSPLLQPFCFQGFTPKRGGGGTIELWCLCFCTNLSFLIMISLYSEPQITVLISLSASLRVSQVQLARYFSVVALFTPITSNILLRFLRIG